LCSLGTPFFLLIFPRGSDEDVKAVSRWQEKKDTEGSNGCFPLTPAWRFFLSLFLESGKRKKNGNRNSSSSKFDLTPLGRSVFLLSPSPPSLSASFLAAMRVGVTAVSRASATAPSSRPPQAAMRQQQLRRGPSAMTTPLSSSSSSAVVAAAAALRRRRRRSNPSLLVVRASASFDSLSSSLSKAWDSIRIDGKLTAENIKGPMREIRRALLEADVSFSFFFFSFEFFFGDFDALFSDPNCVFFDNPRA